MPTIRLASASRLALSVPSSGIASPTDDSISYALLDLSAEVPSVAESKLRTILPRLAAQLFLQGDLRLIIASGRLEPKAAASVVADALDTEIPSKLTLGVVRGESLIDRLEELSLAGCSFQQANSKGRLLDEPLPPAAVWAPTGAGPIVEALAAGASIVVTQAADIGTMAIAAAAESFAWPAEALEHYATAAAVTRFALRHRTDAVLCDDGVSLPIRVSLPLSSEEGISQKETRTLPDLSYTATFDSNGEEATTILTDVKPPDAMRRVVATMPIGAKLHALISLPSQEVTSLLNRWQERIPAGVTLSTERVADDSLLLQAHGEHTADVVEAAQDLELLCEQAILRRPLLRDITPCYGPWVTEVPLELLQYGVDVRRTPEWLD